MGTLVRFRARERLWSQGDAADRVLLVTKGAATVSVFTPGGEQHVLSLATRCATIGLDEAIHGGRRQTEVEAIMPSAAMVVRAEGLRSALHAGGEYAVALAGLAARSARRCVRRIQEVGYGTVEQRLARVLVNLAEEHGLPDARGTLVPIPLSRTRLAVLIGCRVETLVRTLKAPRTRDAFTFLREGVLVHDLPGLRESMGR